VESLVLDNEPTIRLACFLGGLAAMAVWETIAPRRRRIAPRTLRWLSNIAIVILGTVLVRLIFPVLAVGLALLAEARGWGFLNAFEIPLWLALIASVLVLDLAIYLQHVTFHAVPILWRLHMVHHADRDFDVTTGVRFHPLEIVVSMVIKLAVIAALGPPAVAVVVFEVVLSATSLFNHGNVRMPAGLDRVLRRVVVTPEMHRVHHSVRAHETNSNFGFNLPWWDRLFGTYRAQPEQGHQDMTVGLDQFQSRGPENLWWMLALPFLGETGGYPINRRGTDS
jgi:sterol desaturase/sphingolipid hydroxylase (fatty acid hydroxylase superfamily)